MAGKIKTRRLTIIRGEGFVNITWRRLHWLHILGVIGLPMAAVIVMAGELGLKEVMGNSTIHLSMTGHIVFWSIWLPLFYLMIFNRKSSIIANKEKIVLRKGLFPAFVYTTEIKNVIEICIKEKKEPYINATDYPGPNLGPFYRVLITHTGGKPIRTDTFIKEEAERICEEIKQFR